MIQACPFLNLCPKTKSVRLVPLTAISLHAALSAEATERLAAQKRLSSITSLIIALLMTLLIGIILFIIPIAINKEKVVIDVVYSAPGEKEQELVVNKVNITRGTGAGR